MNNFEGKVVLITGAGLGLGRKLAVEFAARGAIVAVNDLTPVNVDDLVDEITTSGGRVKSYLADVAKKVAVQTMLTDILEEWQRIDILINHANVKPQFALLDMDEWDWHRALEVNLTGAFLTLQSVGRVMRELGAGVILNLAANDNNEVKRKLSGAYFSANAGVIELTRRAANELNEHNIRVNAVCSDSDNYERAISEVMKLCSLEDKRTGEILKCV